MIDDDVLKVVIPLVVFGLLLRFIGMQQRNKSLYIVSTIPIAIGLLLKR